MWLGYIGIDFRYWYHDWVACIYWWVVSVPWGGGGGGRLMTDSGLEEILNSSFGGVPNMLAGKRFP